MDRVPEIEGKVMGLCLRFNYRLTARHANNGLQKPDLRIWKNQGEGSQIEFTDPKSHTAFGPYDSSRLTVIEEYNKKSYAEAITNRISWSLLPLFRGRYQSILVEVEGIFERCLDTSISILYETACHMVLPTMNRATIRVSVRCKEMGLAVSRDLLFYCLRKI